MKDKDISIDETIALLKEIESKFKELHEIWDRCESHLESGSQKAA
jgi:hypothetical protein